MIFEVVDRYEGKKECMLCKETGLFNYSSYDDGNKEVFVCESCLHSLTRLGFNTLKEER